MESCYQVLARKYRSQKFSELIGQEALVQTLTNAIKNNKVPHAFILTGIRGVGKTSTARLIAKSLNCAGADGNGKETIEPCLVCQHCKAIANSVDQDVIEFDAASHTGVNDIRDIIDNINYPPVSSRYKIYIIDEVHMLSNSAFNALLKTLEEPPAHVKFIFATTEIKKVPITILSRCIRFDLNRVDKDKISKHLMEISKKEGYELSENSANLIAYASEGSVRDSLSILDRVISFNNYNSKIEDSVVENTLNLNKKRDYYELYSYLICCDIQKIINKFENIYLSMSSSNEFINELMSITHKILLKKNNINVDNISAFENEWLHDNFNKITFSVLFRVWQFLTKALQDIKYVDNDKNFLEVLLLKIVYGANIPEINDIIKKLQNNLININIKKDSDKGEELVGKILSKFEGSKIN